MYPLPGVVLAVGGQFSLCEFGEDFTVSKVESLSIVQTLCYSQSKKEGNLIPKTTCLLWCRPHEKGSHLR